MTIFIKSFTRIASALAAFLAAGAAGIVDRQDDGTRPPLGVIATQMTLAQLRAAYLHAAGAPLPASSVEHWNLAQDGLTGTMIVTRRGNDMREDVAIADKLRTADGVLAQRAWEQNASGEITYPSGIHRRDEVDAAALGKMGPGVTLLGMRPNPQGAYVVRVDPPGGRLEYVYFDASTFLIDRIDQARNGSRVIFTFDDYRSVGGHMMPATCTAWSCGPAWNATVRCKALTSIRRSLPMRSQFPHHPILSRSHTPLTNFPHTSSPTESC